MMEAVVKYGLVGLALYLCYKCNIHERWFLRVLYLAVAFFFSKYYVFYYIIYHGLLRGPCARAFGTTGVTYM